MSERLLGVQFCLGSVLSEELYSVLAWAGGTSHLAALSHVAQELSWGMSPLVMNMIATCKMLEELGSGVGLAQCLLTRLLDFDSAAAMTACKLVWQMIDAAF